MELDRAVAAKAAEVREWNSPGDRTLSLDELDAEPALARCREGDYRLLCEI